MVVENQKYAPFQQVIRTFRLKQTLKITIRKSEIPQISSFILNKITFLQKKIFTINQYPVGKTSIPVLIEKKKTLQKT